MYIYVSLYLEKAPGRFYSGFRTKPKFQFWLEFPGPKRTCLELTLSGLALI